MTEFKDDSVSPDTEYCYIVESYDDQDPPNVAQADEIRIMTERESEPFPILLSALAIVGALTLVFILLWIRKRRVAEVPSEIPSEESSEMHTEEPTEAPFEEPTAVETPLPAPPPPPWHKPPEE